MSEKQSISGRSPNRMIYEKSPYLIQHAYNPVDWHPWGHEAFEKARGENKPVFLSIGYSTCHWCHVMAHESFEDDEVAALLNDAFVCVKVDREERPDIDKVYMSACQMMTRSGGWPLTIVMTPEGEPFFAATYIPRESRLGRVGMLELIPRIKKMWMERREEVKKSAGEIVSLLKRAGEMTQAGNISEDIIDDAYEELRSLFDEEYGGFGPAPKFPMPHQLLFLLRYWREKGQEKALDMVVTTLKAMRCGGIYDHLGYGFHRYSTDEKWLLPHFEKMLYDQALLAIAYIEAYQATNDSVFMQTSREIFNYVLRDMTAPEGGFYSAEDADSEGEEGLFYLWTMDEFIETIGKERADIIARVFQIDKEGNFFDEIKRSKTGRNILHTDKNPAEYALYFGMSEENFLKIFNEARELLFINRKKRIHPHKDDKILTDWNGLMIAAFAKGFQVFSELIYKDAAEKAARFVLEKMTDSNGRLLHRFRDGEAAIKGNLDDYAFFIWGLLECYEAFFDTSYLRLALKLQEDLDIHFWDRAKGGYYFTPDDGEALITRQKEAYDGAIPSGNSVSMLNLLRLARITGNQKYENYAYEIGRFFSGDIAQMPAGYTKLMVSHGFVVNPSHEVVISGIRGDEDTESMLKEIRKRFIPNKIVIFRPANKEFPDIEKIAPFVRDMKALKGKATAYVCSNFSCQSPTTDIKEILRMLNVGVPKKNRSIRICF